jgi:integrase/recombinase XerD
MKEERTTPLRERMIEDMGMREKTQKAHIRGVKDFATFLGRAPDTATPEELRAYQLHMTDAGVSAETFNVRIVSLRFFFGVTCGREEMKRYMQFRHKPRKLPVVLSVEEVADLLAAVPGPGLTYRAALGISYGAGLRAAEVCNLKVTDIDSDRMLIHVDNGKGGRDHKAMLSPGLLDLLRDYWREARPEGWLFPGKPKINPLSPRQLNRAFTSAKTHGRYRQARDVAHPTAQLRDTSARGEHRRTGDPGPARPGESGRLAALNVFTKSEATACTKASPRRPSLTRWRDEHAVQIVVVPPGAHRNVQAVPHGRRHGGGADLASRIQGARCGTDGRRKPYRRSSGGCAV